MQFCWVGQRIIDSIGLHVLLPIRSIIACDFGIESPQVARSCGARIHSIEEASGIRKAWSSYHIEEAIARLIDAYGLEIFGQMKTGIIAYRAAPILEQVIADPMGSHLRLLAPPSDVVKRLDDKLYTFEGLTSAHISQPRSIIQVAQTSDYEHIKQQLGNELVIKERLSSSGSGVHFISDRASFEDVISRIGHQSVLISERVSGLSYNVHVVVNEERVLISAPSVQLVGLQECATKPSIYCGNDFAALASVDKETLVTIESMALAIGQWMAKDGFRGLFGADFVGSGNQIYIVDINPRLQGSTSLLTQAELLLGRTPTIQGHIATYLPLQQEVRNLPMGYQTEPLSGAQIILHSLSDYPAEVRGSLLPGIYTANRKGHLDYARPGLSLLDCVGTDEFLITCAVPSVGTIVEPGASLLKIVTLGSIIDIETGRLNSRASAISEEVYDRMKLVSF